MKISLLPDGGTPQAIDEYPARRGAGNVKHTFLQLVLTPLADHEAAANPHPGYLTPAEGGALYDTLGAAASAVAAHEAAADPHPTYLRVVESDLLYDALGASGAAVATHVALADPHTQYQRESEKDQASGYAGLSASSKLTGAQQTYGSAVNTACEGNDTRLSNSRTPTAHATSHQSGGSDPIALDLLAAPTDVTTLNASLTAHGLLPKLGGGTTNFLRADGTWAAPAAGGDDVLYAPTTSDIAINSITDVTIATKAIASAAAGDQYLVDAWFVILNNSTATRVITLTLDFNAAFDIELSTGALAFSTTLLHPFRLQGILDIRSTSLAYMMSMVEGQLPAGMAAGADTAVAATPVAAYGWNTVASNLTGTCTAILKARSASATATQTLRLHYFTIRKIRPIP